MALIHIGLGKTGSTTLQKSVFPELVKIRPSIRYNDKNLMTLIRAHHLYGLSDSKIDKARGYISDDSLISNEGLINWNPRMWEFAADRNLELFGNTSTIVICIRETVSYLTSLYQQQVREGNVKKACEFFVKSDEYDRITKHISPSKLEYFDVDSLNFFKLYEIYNKRFKNVIFINFDDLGGLNFLKDSYGLSPSELKWLRELYHSSKYRNKAFSALAMKLTLNRENLLNYFSLKSMATYDRSLIKGLRSFDMNVESDGTVLSEYSNVWSKLMVSLVDRIAPYKKFELPKDVAVDERILQKNCEFMGQLKESKLI